MQVARGARPASLEFGPPALADTHGRRSGEACLTKAARGAADHSAIGNRAVITGSPPHIRGQYRSYDDCSSTSGHEVIPGHHQAGEAGALLEGHITGGDDDPLSGAATDGDVAQRAHHGEIRGAGAVAPWITPVRDVKRVTRAGSHHGRRCHDRAGGNREVHRQPRH